MSGACPACGGALLPWRSLPGAEPADPARYPLARCAGCGTAVTGGPPPPPDRHEAGAYGGGAPRLSGVARPVLRAFDRQRLGFLRPWAPPPAALLDVGAGRGRFVASARAAGYDARGLEPSARGIEGAAAAGIALERATLETADVAPASLDAVTAWHVVEHLDDPAGAVARLASWLRPGGALLVGVPNLASLQAALGGDRWFHLDLPRHRTHLTAAGARALLARAGLVVRTEHHVLAEHNPYGLWSSVVSRATRDPQWLFNALKRNAPLRSSDAVVTAAAVPLAPVAAAAEALAGAAGRGGTVAVVATRPPAGTSG